MGTDAKVRKNHHLLGGDRQAIADKGHFTHSFNLEGGEGEDVGFSWGASQPPHIMVRRVSPGYILKRKPEFSSDRVYADPPWEMPGIVDMRQHRQPPGIDDSYCPPLISLEERGIGFEASDIQ